MLRRSLTGLTLNIKIQKNIPLRRIGALFLFVVFVVSIIVPPASAYADEQELQRVTGKPPAGKVSKEAPNPDPAPVAKDKQKLAGPLPQTKADYTMAETGKLATTVPGVKQPDAAPQKPKPGEILAKRTATKQVFRQADGTLKERQYAAPKFYKKDGNWQSIDMSLIEDKNAGDASNIVGQLFGQAQSVVDSEQAFIVKENDWQARFAPSDFAGGMVRIKQGGEQFGFSPINAKRVAPVVTTEHEHQVVYYYDLWPGINVRYTVYSNQVKEDIIVKDKDATTNYAFKLNGVTLEADAKTPGGYRIKGKFGDKSGITPLMVTLNNSGPISEKVFRQELKNGELHISIDKPYLQTLRAEDFPVIVDPSYVPTLDVIGSIGFKSDLATSCGNFCPYIYAGSAQQGGVWRSWRALFRADYSFLNSYTDVLSAVLIAPQVDGSTGTWSFQAQHAVCTTGYDCYNPYLAGPPNGNVNDWLELDVTDIYQSLKNANEYGGWLMVRGQECGCASYKSFDAASAYVEFIYNYRPATPVPEMPTNNSTVITTQPVLGVTSSFDNPSENDPVKYAYQIRSTNGVVLYQTEWLDQNRLTVPEGILQDGGNYSWSFAVSDGWYNSGGTIWNTGGNFSVDLRTGKDKTSTYDEVGPVSVSLNTGNVYTNVSTHNIKALAGNIGLDLSYNSPNAARMGVRASYYNNQTWTGDPVMRRTEASVD
ncbi:MAG TPA: hypothetical protein VLF43_04715, partial [Candidatus Saccharimonadales bacterium]|nr:hypothetical protein [Candidatus Saccharimonadales bacterium]